MCGRLVLMPTPPFRLCNWPRRSPSAATKITPEEEQRTYAMAGVSFDGNYDNLAYLRFHKNRGQSVNPELDAR